MSSGDTIHQDNPDRDNRRNPTNEDVRGYLRDILESLPNTVPANVRDHINAAHVGLGGPDVPRGQK